MTTSFSLVSQLVPLRFHPVPLKSACMAMAGITKAQHDERLNGGLRH